MNRLLVTSVGAVFNLGGGRANSVSILEAFDRVASLTGKAMRYNYVERPRAGDHICCLSDLARLKQGLPGWNITKSLDDTFAEIGGHLGGPPGDAAARRQRRGSAR